MTRLRLALACVAIVVAGSACKGGARAGSTPPVNRETLTPEEFNQRNFYSAYDAVAALRPIWLSPRGVDGVVQVYVDDVLLGGPEALRTVRIMSVAVIRHMDGIQAMARYGRGHQQGAILITTRAAGR